MRRLETPPRARSMVSMIKTLGERLSSSPSGLPVVDDHVAPRMHAERPTPPLPPSHSAAGHSHLKTLQRR